MRLMTCTEALWRVRKPCLQGKVRALQRMLRCCFVMTLPCLCSGISPTRAASLHNNIGVRASQRMHLINASLAMLQVTLMRLGRVQEALAAVDSGLRVAPVGSANHAYLVENRRDFIATMTSMYTDCLSETHAHHRQQCCRFHPNGCPAQHQNTSGPTTTVVSILMDLGEQKRVDALPRG